MMIIGNIPFEVGAIAKWRNEYLRHPYINRTQSTVDGVFSKGCPSGVPMDGTKVVMNCRKAKAEKMARKLQRELPLPGSVSLPGIRRPSHALKVLRRIQRSKHEMKNDRQERRHF
ncbi:hypothetical protein M514_01358 [Trichuris suis]|uniref:Uncharacterized protein n=1 Tax=Trichuris suis TaxID=68888 RepID=A0A085MKE2_9BILA|nr:hypothetical protein M513_01358 [Trichuris suis]KFD72227.1 hypothetical protein M514_01358 [Trichuris suis]